MRRSAFIVLVAALAASPAGARQHSGLDWMPLEEAVARADSSGRAILVFVSAPWCGPCHRLEEETFTDPVVRETLAAFELARLTFDEKDRRQRIGRYRLPEAAWAERLGATATPTFVFMRSDLSILGRQQGYLPAEGLLPLLTAALEAEDTRP